MARAVSAAELPEIAVLAQKTLAPPADRHASTSARRATEIRATPPSTRHANAFRVAGAAAAFGVWSGGTFAAGYAVRRSDDAAKDRELPPAPPAGVLRRGAAQRKTAHRDPKLASIVGAAHAERDAEQRGSRLGRGVAHAVVRPGTIQEAIDCLQACVDGDVA